jgi:hypothetical protein
MLDKICQLARSAGDAIMQVYDCAVTAAAKRIRFDYQYHSSVVAAMAQC